MTDYDLENQSRELLRLIKSLPVHDRSYRNWNRRTAIVKYVLQHSLGRDNSLAMDLPQRRDAFNPLPLNAAVDAQWIFCTHWINLADKLLRGLNQSIT